MEVRCEKCLTIYDFDDAKVTEAGVTVKCTQCGNLFRVRRRVTYPMGELPTMAPPPVAAPPPPANPTPNPANTQAEVRLWMLRSAATGDVRRFRELTTLQQWIVERKVTRDDEISRTGDSWKKLGGIAELASFFHVVEQADRAAQERESAREQSEVTTPRTTMSYEQQRSSAAGNAGGNASGAAAAGAPWRTPTAVPAAPRPGRPNTHSRAPTAVARPTSASDHAKTGPYEPRGDGVEARRQPPAPAAPPPRRDETPLPPPVPPPPPTGQTPQLRAPSGAFPTLPDDYGAPRPDEDEGDALPRRGGSSVGKVLGIAAVLALAAGGVYWFGFHRNAGTSDKAADATRRGYALLALDSDDQLRLAQEQFLLAHGADDTRAQPLAALAELNALWGGYLADEARNAKLPGRADELRREAQPHLDDAKRYAEQAQTIAPEDPDVNRAMATYLLVTGAPATQVEDSLRRVADKLPDDPEVHYLRGALALRDGRPADAKPHFDEANRRARASTQNDFIRADYQLAQIAFTAGQRDEARGLAQRVLQLNPRHERARNLLSLIDSTPPVAAAPPTVAAAGAPDPANGAANPTAATAPPAAATAPPAPAAAANPPPATAPAVAAAPPATRPEGKDAPKPEKPEPKGYDALVEQGNKLSEHGKSKEAQKLFEKALEERPDGVEANTGMAYCMLDSEHFNAAIDRFKHALRVVPSYGEALIGLAETYKVRGDKRQALEYYQKYISELPHGPKATMAQANISELEPEVKAHPNEEHSSGAATIPADNSTPSPPP